MKAVLMKNIGGKVLIMKPNYTVRYQRVCGGRVSFDFGEVKYQC